MTNIHRTLIAIALIGAGAGCTSRVDLEKVPIGTPVEVTRQDGGVVRGTLAARDDRNVRMAVGKATRSIPRDQITSVELANTDAPPPLPAVAKFREYTLTAGTVLTARLDTALGSDTSKVDDPVEATLTEAAIVDDVEVLPAGSVVKGVVTTADPSQKVKGRASLTVRFRSISLAGRDETYALSAGLHHTAAATKNDDAKKIVIPAAGGAILGAIIGGKKGASIGAIIGGGAGAVVVLTTSGPQVRYARDAVLSLSVDEAIDVRVPIKR